MFKTETCILMCCDHCQSPLEHDYVVHYLDEQMALDDARDNDWIVTRDGRVYCRGCDTKAPACVCERDECDDSTCPVGCPCLLHDEVRPGGACPEPGCGQTFDRWYPLRLHELGHERVKAREAVTDVAVG